MAREDGTLGLEETVAPGVWEEQVDETITDLHNQSLVCRKLGLAQSWGEMTELHRVIMHRCVATADKIALSRHAPDEEGASGWRVICLDKHEDEQAIGVPLGQVMADFPYLRQFLALPPETAVVLAPPQRPDGAVTAMVLHQGNDLTELWAQQQMVAGLGPEEWTTFPTDAQNATVTDCVDDSASAVRLFREPADDPAHSGWILSCTRPHEHGVGHLRSLWDLTQSLPFVTRFLALPRAAEVLIETPRGLRGSEIRASVRIFGNELVPEPGSYTAELLGRTA